MTRLPSILSKFEILLCQTASFASRRLTTLLPIVRIDDVVDVGVAEAVESRAYTQSVSAHVLPDQILAELQLRQILIAQNAVRRMARLAPNDGQKLARMLEVDRHFGQRRPELLALGHDAVEVLVDAVVDVVHALVVVLVLVLVQVRGLLQALADQLGHQREGRGREVAARLGNHFYGRVREELLDGFVENVRSLSEK